MKLIFRLIIYALTIINKINIIEGEVKGLNNDDSLLPTLFNKEDTEKCPYGNLYCKIDIKLKPLNENNITENWKAIKKMVEDNKEIYKKDRIYRGICAENDGFDKNYTEYNNIGINGVIENSFCAIMTETKLNYDTTDLFFVSTVTLYFMLMLYCTFKNIKGNKYLEIFSIKNILSDIRKPNRSEDFQKLLSIQGMRTIIMILVISTHTFFASALSFLENPYYLENLYANPFKQLIIGVFGLLVQFFFTTSAWLLALQLKNIIKKNGKLTIKDVFILGLNRYFRLIPAVIIVLFLHRSTFFSIVPAVLNKPLYSTELRRCQEGWWRNLLFIQNLAIFEGRICSPGTWYIAADTQMYLILLILFYLSEKFKISMNKILITVMILTLTIQSYFVLTTDFDGLIRFSPRLLPLETAFESQEFLHSYAGTITNMATYVIGFTFGTIYYQNKNKKIFNTKIKRFFWYFTFIGIILLATSLYPITYNIPRILETLLSISLRPLFSLGIAIGILGMSSGNGGIIKKVLEWQPLVFLGNFTYSVYMFHFINVFARTLSYDEMLYLSDSFYLKGLTIDVISSFILGTFMYIVAEHPFGKFQKLILPQIITKKETSKMK